MLDELITFQKRALEKLRNHCAAALNEYKNSRENQVVSFTAPKQTRDWYLFRPNNPGCDRYQSPCRTRFLVMKWRIEHVTFPDHRLSGTVPR